MRLSLLKPDWMHTVDLGIRQYAGGCIVYDMFRKVGGTFRNWHDACGILLNLFKMAARHINVAMLTLGMIRTAKGKKTKLKLKAYEGRKFTPILIATLMNFIKIDNLDGLRLDCLNALDRCDFEMEHWGEDSSRLRLARFGRQHLECYKQLGELQEDPLMYCLFPKHHMFIHVTESHTNPRLLWCYGDEDEIGKAVGICKSVSAFHVDTMLMERYRLTFDCA